MRPCLRATTIKFLNTLSIKQRDTSLYERTVRRYWLRIHSYGVKAIFDRLKIRAFNPFFRTKTTLTVRKFRRLSVQTFERLVKVTFLAATVENISGAVWAKYDRLNFCTAKAEWHGCVVTKLRDAMLDLLKNRTVHRQMVKPLKLS